jgi:hypothetical protein
MFRFFPRIDYKIDNYDSLLGVDITERVKINDYLRNINAYNVRDYEIKEGELPENIAYNVYGNPSYAYIILMSNNIQNFYDEWPKDDYTLKKYITEKYGSITSANTTVAHYYLDIGIICDENTYNISSNTNKYIENVYEYEKRLNNEKRKIKLIESTLVRKIEVAIEEIMSSTSSTIGNF